MMPLMQNCPRGVHTEAVTVDGPDGRKNILEFRSGGDERLASLIALILHKVLDEA